MPYFLTRAKSDAASWDRLMRNPEDRRGMSQSANRELGGETVGYWYSTGRYDTFAIAKLPDNIGAVAGRSKLFSSGAFGELTRTVLMTVEEMKRVAGLIEQSPTLRNFHAAGE